MKFLIAGLGSIGRRHLRNLLTLGERDIILYRTHLSTLPDDELAGFPVETDLRAALAYGPDAVIISNPTALHLDVAIPAARCGCHLLIEKPISHSLAHLDELQQVVVENDVRVLVGYQFRFHSGMQRIKKWLNDEAIGEPLSVRAHWGEYLPDWHPWEDYTQGYAARPELGGGVVLTLSHPLDYLHWFFGDVESLRSFTNQRGLYMPVEDEAEILVQFISGVLASVHLDYTQRPATHWLEILGSRGSLHWDNSDGVARIMQVDADGNIGDWQEFAPRKGFDRNTMFLDELRHFREVVKGKADPACSLHDGVIALQLALAALKKYVIRVT